MFHSDSAKVLEQVAQREGGCLALGDIQGNTRQGSEQLDLAVDITVDCKVFGLEDL